MTEADEEITSLKDECERLASNLVPYAYVRMRSDQGWYLGEVYEPRRPGGHTESCAEVLRPLHPTVCKSELAAWKALRVELLRNS